MCQRWSNGTEDVIGKFLVNQLYIICQKNIQNANSHTGGNSYALYCNYSNIIVQLICWFGQIICPQGAIQGIYGSYSIGRLADV